MAFPVVCGYALWHCAQHFAISCHFASSFFHLKQEVRAKRKTLLVQYLDGLNIEKTKKKRGKKTLNIYEFLLYTAYFDVSSLFHMRPQTIQRILLTLMFWFSFLQTFFSTAGLHNFYTSRTVCSMNSLFYFLRNTEVKAGTDVVCRIFKPWACPVLSVSLPYLRFYLYDAALELFFLICLYDTWAKLAPFSARPAG